MKADNPIDIKFVKGNSFVDLTSTGGISDTSITAKDLSLANLETGGGDINVNYNAIGTGNLSVASRSKNTVINATGAIYFTISQVGGENLTLNTTGDIRGKGDARFDSLNFNSAKGKVDFNFRNSGLIPLIQKALNVTAAKDINIDYYDNDYNYYSTLYLPLGTIESKTGDVSIKANTHLDSAVTERNNPTTSTQIQNWKDAGILNTWSQTELVNALNANALSKDPYTVDLAPTANIIANKVTLDVGTGIAKTISYSNLKNEDNLKLLANARAGDLEWGDNSVTYTPHDPIGLTLKDHSSSWNLYLKNAHNSINLAAADNKTAFNIKTDGSIGSTDEDIILNSAEGLYLKNSTMQAKNLILRGGNGSIYLENGRYYMLDAITGDVLHLSADFGGDLYIKNAISDSALTLNFPNANLLKGSNDGYISSGSKNNVISVNCRTFSNGPSILANGTKLLFNVSEGDIYLNAVTREGLVNKINKRRVKGSNKKYYSPEDVFVS